LRSLSFDNNGLVKPSCGTVALYGPFGFFLRYGGLSMNNLVIINETYKFNLQSSLSANKIYNFNK
jgi:hypothetical protein